MKTKGIIILFLFFANIVFAQEYDINDPRNPNCPCHKMQQQADEEFAQMNNGNKNIFQNPIQINDSDNDNGNHLSAFDENSQKLDNRSVKQENTISYTSFRKKRKSVWIKKTVFKFSNKHRFKKRGKIKVALCYNWQ